MEYQAPPESKASRISSNVRADTRTPAPKATTPATSRRGREVKTPSTAPIRKLELASAPNRIAVLTMHLPAEVETRQYPKAGIRNGRSARA